MYRNYYTEDAGYDSRLQFLRTPGQSKTEGNITADQSAKFGKREDEVGNLINLHLNLMEFKYDSCAVG